MLEELVSQARKIEAETDANIGGAVVQVTKNLSFEQLEELANEVGQRRFSKAIGWHKASLESGDWGVYRGEKASLSNLRTFAEGQVLAAAR